MSSKQYESHQIQNVHFFAEILNWLSTKKKMLQTTTEVYAFNMKEKKHMKRNNEVGA